MYEHRSQPPLTRVAFAARMLHHFLLAIGFVVLSLAGGMVGQLTFERGVSLHDAFLNAVMLLGGMGPTEPHPTNAVARFLPVYMLCTLGFFFW